MSSMSNELPAAVARWKILLARQASQNGKEVKTMRYNKPEVAVLGSASRVIENLVKNHDFSTDIYTQTVGLKGKVQTPPPAYDLDE